MKSIFKSHLLALLFVPFLSIGFVACEDDDDSSSSGGGIICNASDSGLYNATIHMKQLANNLTVSLRSDDVKPYSNERGQSFNISRLRYLISDITFHKSDGSSFQIEEYHFVDLADTSTLTFTPSTQIPGGCYSSISFTFGFDSTDNSGIYPDLNTVNWNWPMMLGGGYHYMQLEGTYDSVGVDKFFATHMGTARNQNTTPTTFEDNSFIAQPANSAISVNADIDFDITMNVEQWYEDTFQWDFTVWNVPIMPIYDAQIRLNENGPTVFTITVN